MVNQSKTKDPRFWKKWGNSGAIGNIRGRTIGEAYAFFDCNAPVDKFAREIPPIRAVVKTPNRLELLLAERALLLMHGKDYEGDSELLEIAQAAKEEGIRYVLSARSPNMANSGVADELAGILNQAYQSPLYEDKEPFRGWIFYREDGHNHYVERE